MPLTTLTRTPEQLDAILRAGAGSLVETPYPVLLLALALRQETAVLALHRNQLQKEILFEEGSPVDCQSNIATETFARFLVSSGKLAEPDCQAALALSASRGKPFEEILLAQNLFPRAELERMLQQSLGRKLLEPFSWKSGTFAISFDVPPAVASPLRVKVPQLVLTGILKVETQETVDQEVAVAGDHYLGLASEPLFDLTEIRLTADQQKIVEAARAGKRLGEAVAQSEIDADDVLRIVYALLLLGAFTLTEQPIRAEPFFELENPFSRGTIEEAVPAPFPVPLAPEPVSPAAAPPHPGLAAATAAELLEAHRAHREKDPFELLEVADGDGPLQFIRAFLRAADRFLPSKFDARDGLRDKAQDVFLAAARAYAELADPVRRDALLVLRALKNRSQADTETTLVVPLPLQEPAPPVQPPPARPMERRPMQATLIDPELLSRSGRELADAGKLREALSSFEMAAECDAQNGTYAAEVAWCRFRLQVSPAPATLKMLKNAIRIDPRSGLAHLYAGKVATTLGNRNEASTFLNRAAMLMPRDLRVVEALKALR
ncbi:MAG: DUF4388 domain-containing protein [Acidobacteriota bacterium]